MNHEQTTSECPLDEEEDTDWGELPYLQYSSPERKAISRASPISNFNLENLSQGAAQIFNESKEQLLKCDSFRAQVIQTVQLLRPNDSAPLASFSQIGSIFGVKKGTIASHCNRGIEINEQGRPSELADEEINEVIYFIHEKYFSKDPATFESILNFIKDRFDKDIIMKTLYGQLSRLPQIKTLDGIPMEDDRVNCSIEAIDKYYNDLEQLLKSHVIPSTFVFNIDEAGFADWADSTNIAVVVPADANDEDIKVPVDRNGKRASLLAGICADGSTLISAVAIPRKTIEEELYEFGYTSDKVCYCYSESGFFSNDSFLTWAFEYFFDEVEQKRQRYDYSGECLLILDGFAPHENDIFLEECSKRGIIPFFLAPHSSDQTQPLDIGIFGVQKAKMNRMSVPEGLNKQSAQLIKIIDSFRQATTISNVIASFRGAGIVSSYTAENGLVPRVDRSQAFRVRHWVNARYETFNKKRIHL